MSTLHFHPECISCILGKYIHAVPQGTDPVQHLAYAKEILRLIADAGDTVTAPEIVAAVTALRNTMFGYIDDFDAVKQHFNALMLSKEQGFGAYIAAADDPLLCAARFAMLGNYIDFGALDSVDETKLDTIPADAQKVCIADTEYDNFRQDLQNGKRLVYITDNCGEIVMDKLFLQQIKAQYPHLQINVLVRGAAVLNDATVEDAAQIGLDKLFSVHGNSTNIAGTCLTKISGEILSLIDCADVIIAKGQGNFETLCGCGKNVYYLFLCKCHLFAERFSVPQYTGMFLNEKRLDKHI